MSDDNERNTRSDTSKDRWPLGRRRMLQLTGAGIAGLGTVGASGVASAASSDCAAGPFESTITGATINVAHVKTKQANKGHRDISTGQPRSNGKMTKMRKAGEQSSGPDAQSPNGDGQNLSIETEYDGIDAEETTGGVPSDSQIAAGKSKVVHAVNTEVAAFNKHSGNEQFRVGLADLFGPVIPTPEGGFAGDGPLVFDPRARYDRDADRFVVAAVQSVSAITEDGEYVDKEEFEEGEEDAADDEFTRPPKGYFLVAVSDNSNPNGKWNVYRLAPKKNTGLVDYPQLGLDSEAIYLTQNFFPSGFGGVTMAIFDKAALYAGEETTVNEFTDLDNPEDNLIDFTVQPSLQPFSGGSSGPFYFLNSYPYLAVSGLTIWELTDPLDEPSLSCDTVETEPYVFPPAAHQKGGDADSFIDTLGNRLMNVDYNDGSLWTAHTVAANGVAAIKWYEIDAASHEVLQSGVYGEAGTSYYIPTLRSNDDTTVISHNVSGPDTYVQMDIAGRTADFEEGEIEDSVVVEEGKSVYDFGEGFGTVANPLRWGDYNGVSLDPKTGSFWAVSQYSPDIEVPPEADRRDPYHTRIAEVTFDGDNGKNKNKGKDKGHGR